MYTDMYDFGNSDDGWVLRRIRVRKQNYDFYELFIGGEKFKPKEGTICGVYGRK
jgi:hypothetical protein